MMRNDPQSIRMQIIWNRLIAVVEEQAKSLIRASFSLAVREAGDLGAGIFDTRGRMLAQAVTGTPGHVNSMAIAVPHFLAEIPSQTMRPGDCYITNDPWLASGHLHDVTIVTPAFYRERLIGLFAATVHLVDVGGRGLTTDGRQVFEEGVCIPIMPLVREGTVNADLMRIFAANSREPLMVEGDIMAIIGAGASATQRLVAMMNEFALENLDTVSNHIIDNSRRATLSAIAELRGGIYRHRMTIDGYDAPVTLAATVEVKDDEINIDFDGTSPASSYGINVVLNYTTAYASYGVKCLLAPHVPNNHGSIEPIHVTAPPGCILNAPRPLPVAARHVIGHAIPDLILGCIDQALAQGAMAESSMMWNPSLRGSHAIDGSERPWEAFFFNSGGTGARPGRDGMSATAFPAGVSSIPVEVFESMVPVLVRRKELRPGSGGAGEFRGGLGQTVEIEHLDHNLPLQFSAMFDRVLNAAAGRRGGSAGAPGMIRLRSGKIMNAKGMQTIPPGDALILELPGGGGFGLASLRKVTAVKDDIADGLIGDEEAKAVYGLQSTKTGPC